MQYVPLGFPSFDAAATAAAVADAIELPTLIDPPVPPPVPPNDKDALVGGSSFCACSLKIIKSNKT